MRSAIRALLRRPAFTATCVLVLALGIGANTAVFSVAYAVLLKPLPYRDPGRIVVLHETNQQGGYHNVSRLDFQDWKRQAQSFEAMAYYTGETASVFVKNRPLKVGALAVSDGWFEAVGLAPATGRLFLDNERKLNGPRAAVISDHFRRAIYGSDSGGVLGSTLKLDKDVYVVVGVLPSGFRFPGKTDIWVPLELFPDDSTRSAHNYEAIGRLRAGVSLAEAQAEMSTIAARLGASYPDSNRNVGAAVVPLHREVTGPARPSLLVLLAAVAGVLLIACANVANLMLAEAVGRQRELAVRAALGAGRGRIVRHLLLEGALLAAAGCCAGALFAWWVKDVLLAFGPAAVAQAAAGALSSTVLFVSVTISALSVLLFGLAPALAGARLDLNTALKQGGRTTGGRGEGWLRSTLAVAEISLSIALAVAAGLTARSLINLENVSPGFDTRNVLLADFSIPGASRTEQMRSIRAYQDLLRRTRAMPGVVAASAERQAPLTGRSGNGSFGIDGGAFKDEVHAGFNIIAPDYFRTLRIPMRAGREFDDADQYDAPAVAVINESLARRYFPGENPVGHKILTGFDFEKRWMTIVGVAGDTRNLALQTPPAPEIYMPFTQHPVAAPDMTVMVRTEGDFRGLIAPLRKEIAAIDREIPVDFETFDELRARSLGSPRFRAAMLGGFAVLALVLAAVGVYAVMAFVLRRRTAEMGIRIALGAQRGSIFRLAIGRAARLGLIGAVIGLAIAWAATRGLAALLYGVTPNDPVTYVCVAILLFAAAAAAGYPPARRAMRVDPVVALRDE